MKLAVGKGKVDYDKREDIRKRDSDRELKRVMMQHVKGKALLKTKKASTWRPLRDENEMERVWLQADSFHWRLGALVIIPF